MLVCNGRLRVAGSWAVMEVGIDWKVWFALGSPGGQPLDSLTDLRIGLW
jgi:hypothetical protein